MDVDLERRAADVFKAALVLTGSERASFLEWQCREDESLRRDVQSLLDADGAAEDFLVPVFPAAAADAPERMIGDRVGRYRIRRLIAAGGMGAVYEAEQDHSRRTIALKLMKRGVTSRSALRRFEHESQVLARLHHPGIAQVYDVGVHDGGAGPVPFFVMEYVPEPRTLTDYARSENLGTRERLELFIGICDAVHHGHQKGVIHCDLKPANILIASSGQAKIIDFGVARTTDSNLAVTTLGLLIGTLQYMSPEQVEADPDDLDARSDVYALGVVLYELVCDGPPYDVDGARLHEAKRMIREDPPAPPSTIDRALRGGLETIILKALAKDRERRQQSARDLATDIRRFLSCYEPLNPQIPRRRFRNASSMFGRGANPYA